MTFAGADQVAGTVALVAQPTTEKDPGGQGEDFGKSSPVGLLVVLLLLVAVVFLIRSMTKHLRRVPESFDPPPEGEDRETAPLSNGKSNGESGGADGPEEDGAAKS
jgi:hypothetical protein